MNSAKTFQISGGFSNKHHNDIVTDIQLCQPVSPHSFSQNIYVRGTLYTDIFGPKMEEAPQPQPQVGQPATPQLSIGSLSGCLTFGIQIGFVRQDLSMPIEELNMSMLKDIVMSLVKQEVGVTGFC